MGWAREGGARDRCSRSPWSLDHRGSVDFRAAARAIYRRPRIALVHVTQRARAGSAQPARDRDVLAGEERRSTLASPIGTSWAISRWAYPSGAPRAREALAAPRRSRSRRM